MSLLQAVRTMKARLSKSLVTGYHPKQFARSITTGMLIYILESVIVISFAALIFSGDLSSLLSYGIGFILLGDALLCAVISLLSSFPVSIAVEQDAPSAILALGVATVLTAMPAGASLGQRFSTVVVMIVGTTIATGLFFLLLGYFKLGGLVRFLPYPIVGGFLAGTGWLLFTGGIGVMTSPVNVLEMVEPAVLVRWLPGAIFGVILLIAVNRSSNPLALPVLFAISIGLFYTTAWLLKIPFAQLTSGNWLLGPFASGGIWQFPLNKDLLQQVNWTVLADKILFFPPVLIVSVIAFLLNASALELVVKKDMDLSHELMIAGLGNLASGLGGGIPGYHTVSLSKLNHTLSPGSRVTGLMTALLLFITVWIGTSFLVYIPKFILGGLLVFLGLSLIMDWVYQAWFKFPKIDFVIILLILTTIAWRGFMFGIAVGLVMTIIMFVVDYSQINVVRHALPWGIYQSRFTRSRSQVEILNAFAQQFFILRLQGFIFFGTAHRLFEQVRDQVKRTGTTPLRFILLDFERVSGLDSTGLLSFEKMHKMAEEQSIMLILTGLSRKVLDQFIKSGFREQPGFLQFFADLDQGIEYCENQILAENEKNAKKENNLLDQFLEIIPDRARVTRLIHLMKYTEVAPGEYIIHQDDDSDLIFFLESGQISVWLETPDQEPMRLETMSGGRTVGEVGFYLGIKRTASVIADKPCIIYSLRKNDLETMEQQDMETANVLHRIILHLVCERVIRMTKAVDMLER